MALAAVCVAAAPATAARSERSISGWHVISLGISGKHVVVAKSSPARIVPGGFTIFRTDTVRFGLNANRLTGKRTEDIVYRTSAGPTSGGPISGDTTGRYIIVVTGRGTPPQPVFCCTSEPRDIPLEPDGRPDAPVAVAAALDGPWARYILHNPDGTDTLVSQNISDAPGQPMFLRLARPLPGDASTNFAMAPGIIASVDAATRRVIRLDTTSGTNDVFGGTVLPAEPGEITKLMVTRTMVVAIERSDSGFALVRFDAPSWTKTTIASGSSAPRLVAVGDRTVLFLKGTAIMQSTPGRVRQLIRPKGTVVAIATDGRRAAFAERSVRGPRKTAIVVTAILQPPAAYVQGVGS